MPIRKFKLSPKKLFPIIGESLNNPYPRTPDQRSIFDKVRKNRAPENGNATIVKRNFFAGTKLCLNPQLLRIPDIVLRTED